MGGVACFWIEPCETVEISLRRYSQKDRGGPCPGRLGYHNASIVLETAAPRAPDKLYGEHRPPTEEERWDPRWPRLCACGYEFRPDDEWQRNVTRNYRRADTGAVFTIADAPAGAMWDATWWPEKTPDGMTLVVRLPDGQDWMIDGEASNGTPGQPGWSRTGVPPKITARPSIATSKYHGFLTDGVLVSC